MRTITDRETVVLSLEGDTNAEYLWFNQYGDFLGAGQQISTELKRYGLNTIKCITTAATGESNVITNVDEFTVEIDYVNQFVERVNAEILISGGTLEQSYIDAMSDFVSVILRLGSIGQKIMESVLWWPVLPVSPEVAAMDFNDYRNYSNGKYKYTLFGTPTIAANWLYFNGVDQCAYIETASNLTDHQYGGFMLSYIGEGTETGKEWSFARNNNGNRFQMDTDSDGKDVRFSTRDSGNSGSPYGKGNGFYTIHPIDGQRKGYTYFFTGESNETPERIYPDTSSRRTKWGGTSQRHAIGLAEGMTTSETGADMVNFTELEYGGIFFSNQAICEADMKTVNEAWEQYHADLGRAVTY